MHWEDEAIILSVRKQGETSALVNLISRDHGRYHGMAKGVTSKRMAGIFMPGNKVHARWSARLADHLGLLVCDMEKPYAAMIMSDPLKLSCMLSACGLVQEALPERDPQPAIFTMLVNLLDSIAKDNHFINGYCLFELSLLEMLGFGLELDSCAITGEKEGLSHVSPRSGRSVKGDSARDYIDRLLPLPGFLINRSLTANNDEIIQALNLTGHFLERHLREQNRKPMPVTREKILRYLKLRDIEDMFEGNLAISA
jgi:DNA repair protein RecO (recombination protein O)